MWPQNILYDAQGISGLGFGQDNEIRGNEVRAIGEWLPRFSKLINDLGNLPAGIGHSVTIGGQAGHRQQ